MVCNNQSKNQKMNRIINKIKMLMLCFLVTGFTMAQQKLTKVSQSIKVNKDVSLDLNTSYCNIIIDTWNKDVLEVEAYIEGEHLTDEELQNALKNWGVDVDASTDKVSISTQGKSSNVWVYRTDDHGDEVSAIIKELKYEIAEMPEMNFDIHVDAPEIPELPELPELPEMPELPELPEGISSIKFDYSAYKKDGDKYLEAYSKEFEDKYGKEFAKKMEAWGEKFGEEWGEKYGKQMEVWAKNFEGNWDDEAYAKKMEAWGERFAKQMEGQAERIEAQAERMATHAERAHAHKEREENYKVIIKEHKENQKKQNKERVILLNERHKEIEELIHSKANTKVKKTIKIKIPKRAKLKIDVRHGEIEFAANVDNLKADLAYTKLKAISIDGSLTSINASYSPIYITNWNLGELNLNYVKDAEIVNVKNLVLNARSSNIDIENLLSTAIIDGNIGDLNILNINDNFHNLNVILQNSNAVINLPKVDCSVQFKGTRSRFSHPEKPSTENTSNFSIGTAVSGKSIVVNAKYSNVTMQ
jgi:hypothetical protein